MTRDELRKAAEALVDHGCNTLDRELAEAVIRAAQRGVARHYLNGHHSESFGVENGVVICTGSSYEPFKSKSKVL